MTVVFEPPSRRTPEPPAFYLLILSIRSHSSSVTGMTDNLAIRTSGNDAKDLSALMAASVTGAFSFFTGATSTA